MKKRITSLAILTIILILQGCNTMKSEIQQNPERLIHGYASVGFEEVKEEFIKNFTDRGEIGAACCVYYRGDKVVDLWGGFKAPKSDELWEENTLVRVYSTTKGMSLLVLAKLHSEGLLDYNEKVNFYWPEFGKNGKENITVEQLITHKSGLVLLDRSVNVSELHNFKELSSLLENSTPLWNPGEKLGYCAATVGLFEQQLVQRIDQKSRTIGQFFREEIAEPLGVEFYIGFPLEFKSDRLAHLKMISPAQGIFNLHKPPKGMIKQLIKPSSLMNKAFSVIVNDQESELDELSFEEASGGGVGDARSLAEIYGILATGGEELGLSPETMKILVELAPPSEEGYLDVVMGFESEGSRGGYLKPSSIYNFGSKSSFGFSGTGGSFAFADPESELGFAYIMNKMEFYGINDPREIALREAVYHSISKME
jgi:CubicO group peptidase (beta-lactamase class C family)